MSTVVRYSIGPEPDYPNAGRASDYPTAAVAANVVGVLIVIWLSAANVDGVRED